MKTKQYSLVESTKHMLRQSQALSSIRWSIKLKLEKARPKPSDEEVEELLAIALEDLAGEVSQAQIQAHLIRLRKKVAQ